MACQCVVACMEENLVVENLALRDAFEAMDEKGLVAAAKHGKRQSTSKFCHQIT